MANLPGLLPLFGDANLYLTMQKRFPRRNSLGFSSAGYFCANRAKYRISYPIPPNAPEHPEPPYCSRP
jgi:hypothetical protein